MTKKIVLPEKINAQLQAFVPKFYQWGIINALEKQGYKKAMLCWPRRAGKDLTSFTILLRQALKRRGSYLYMLPQHKQARQVIYDGITLDGKRFLDYIPKELIYKELKQEMKIELINGSLIYFCGSNHYDAYRGISPMGIIYSEAAYMHPNAAPTLAPALLYNNGFQIHISTPFGQNHFYDLYQKSSTSTDWYVEHRTILDTKHLTPEQIENQIANGEISYDKAQEEYYCDFSIGAEGAYYAHYLNDMELNEQITTIPWDRGHRVWTAFDLGVNDKTAIIMFQYINNAIYIIDYYENANLGLDHYVQYLKSKPYNFGGHLWPHDGSHRQKSTGEKLSEIASDMGLDVTIVPVQSILSGIETVRNTLSRIYIDEGNCKKLIRAIRDYRKEYDTLRKTYKNSPLHDENSDGADALRTLCTGLSFVKEGMTYEDTLALKQKAQGAAFNPNDPFTQPGRRR